MMQEQVKMLNLQVTDLKVAVESERTKVLEASNSLAATEADYRNLQKKLDEQKQEYEKLSEKFVHQFKHLANEILEEKSKKFTDLNKTNLHDLLKPLGEKITDFEKKVEDTHKDARLLIVVVFWKLIPDRASKARVLSRHVMAWVRARKRLL
jgi:DNA recombination protein RmuC